MQSYRFTCLSCGQESEANNTLPRCPFCGAEGLELQAHDDLGVHLRESLVAHKLGATDESVRLSSDTGRSIRADAPAGGPLTSSISAKPRPNESGNSEVAAILMQRLILDGADWEGFDCDQVQHGDVDCRLRGPSAFMNIQVTRATDDPNIWARIPKGLNVQLSQSVDEAAAELRRAIEKKCRRIAPEQRKPLVLALDAVETPALALSSSVNRFRARHGGWAQQLGFAAIWLVGPTADLTSRLDKLPAAAQA